MYFTYTHLIYLIRFNKILDKRVNIDVGGKGIIHSSWGNSMFLEQLLQKIHKKLEVTGAQRDANLKHLLKAVLRKIKQMDAGYVKES